VQTERAIGYGAIDEETRRWVGAKWLQRASGEDPTSDGDGPAARRSMSGSTPAMEEGADVRMVTVSSDAALFGSGMSLAAETVRSSMSARFRRTPRRKSAAVMRYGYQRGESFEG